MRSFVRFEAAASALIALGSIVGCGQSPMSPTSASPTSAVNASVIAANGVSPSTTVVKIPVAFSIRPSGKAAIQACVGESVTFGGNALFLAHQTARPDGSILLDTIHFNAQGAVAVGDVTGTIYHLNGADSNEVVLEPSGGLTATFTADLHAIGPGTAPNFLAHIVEHITIDANGSMTALVDIANVDCR
jgi:hypothetical protein